MTIIHRLLGGRKSEKSSEVKAVVHNDQLAADMAVARQQNEQAAIRARAVLAGLLDRNDPVFVQGRKK